MEQESTRLSPRFNEGIGNAAASIKLESEGEVLPEVAPPSASQAQMVSRRRRQQQQQKQQHQLRKEAGCLSMKKEEEEEVLEEDAYAGSNKQVPIFLPRVLFTNTLV